MNGKRIGQRQDWEDCRQDGGFHCGGVVNPMKVKRAEKLLDELDQQALFAV